MRFSSYKLGPAPDKNHTFFSCPWCDSDRLSTFSLGLLWKLRQNLHSPEPAAAPHHFPLHPTDPTGLACPHCHPDGAAGVCQQVHLMPAQLSPCHGWRVQSSLWGRGGGVVVVQHTTLTNGGYILQAFFNTELGREYFFLFFKIWFPISMKKKEK